MEPWALLSNLKFEFVSMRVSPSLCACACNARRPRIFVLFTTMPPPTDCVTHHEFPSELINLKPNLYDVWEGAEAT